MQKSHQGRSSFRLQEDQVQDLISCRLALFQLAEKALIEEGGREQVFRRLRKGCKAKELAHAGIPEGDRFVASCLPTVGILPLGFPPSQPTLGLPTLTIDSGVVDFASLMHQLIFHTL